MPEMLRRARHRDRMIAGADRCDAAPALLFAEIECVEHGRAHLEGARALEELELQEDLRLRAENLGGLRSVPDWIEGVTMTCGASFCAALRISATLGAPALLFVSATAKHPKSAQQRGKVGEQREHKGRCRHDAKLPQGRQIGEGRVPESLRR